MFKALFVSFWLIILFSILAWLIFPSLNLGFSSLATNPITPFLAIVMFLMPFVLIGFLGAILYLRRNNE